MSGLLGDLLFDVLLKPISDYFVHGLPLRRVLLRLVTVVLFCAGGALLLIGQPALRPVGLALLVVGTILFLYDTLTLGRYDTRT